MKKISTRQRTLLNNAVVACRFWAQAVQFLKKPVKDKDIDALEKIEMAMYNAMPPTPKTSKPKTKQI